MYAYRDASGWHTETVDAAGENYGSYTSLALDGSGHPHISYHDDTWGDLMYAYVEAPVSVDQAAGSALPGALRLVRVSPNPASTEAAIIYSLGDGHESAPGRVLLRIFDAVGRLVATPGTGAVQPGTHSVPWDLVSSDGTPVSPGVYYLRLEADNTPATDVGRLVIIR